MLTVTGVAAHVRSKVQLDFLNFEHRLVDAVLRDELVDLDFTCLTDSVATVLGLLVVEWIEVDVMHDDHIGCCEVDANSASLGREQEDKDLGIVVEAIDHVLAGK